MTGKFLKLLICLTATIIFAGNVYANTISADTIKTNIEELILNNYKSKTTADVKIRIVMLPFQSLNLPDGEVSYKLVNETDEPDFTSREIKKVNILVNGELQRTIGVPIEVKAYDEVAIAVGEINRGQSINLSKVCMKKINIADKSNFVVTKDMLKKELIAKKDYKDGDFIDKRFVKAKPDVVKNSEVRIIINVNNGLQIAIDGIALADGINGEYITVENKMYNKTYTAKVIGENRVLVNI